jgi:acyl carrier protein
MAGLKSKNWMSQFLDRFVRDEGIDVTGFVRAIELHFDISIAQADWESLQTLGDLCDQLLAKLPPKSRNPESIWLAVRKIASQDFGVDESEFTKQTRFVDDLNC